MKLLRIKPLAAILATAEASSLQRSLGVFQLTMLGVGAIIGTGIFVLTSEAAQKAGPGMMVSFVIAAAVCALAALCYSELASMAPVSGSAYTYTYAVMGELLAWLVGWAATGPACSARLPRSSSRTSASTLSPRRPRRRAIRSGPCRSP